MAEAVGGRGSGAGAATRGERLVSVCFCYSSFRLLGNSRVQNWIFEGSGKPLKSSEREDLSLQENISVARNSIPSSPVQSSQ